MRAGFLIAVGGHPCVRLVDQGTAAFVVLQDAETTPRDGGVQPHVRALERGDGRGQQVPAVAPARPSR